MDSACCSSGGGTRDDADARRPTLAGPTTIRDVPELASPAEPFAGRAILVLDLETDHLVPPSRDLSGLQLTIGAVWDYRTMALAWFDQDTLEDCLIAWTQEPLLFVTHNGKAFDFRILTQHFLRFPALTARLPRWHATCGTSFDLLEAIW